MKLIHSDELKTIISENNSLYTFIRLEKDEWILAFYEENSVSGKIEISALHDNNGLYTKITMKQNKVIRVLGLCNDRISSDTMYDCNKPNPLAEPYIAYTANGQNKKPIPIDIYFSVNRSHSSYKGNVLVSLTLTNKILSHFLEANQRLNPKSNSVHKTKTKKMDD